jgi:cell division protein FtsW (lipid II flippase)
MFSHVRERVQAWLDPWKDISDTGYQVVQGLFAIGTWGWFGSGLTRGIPNKIPFVAADYIFAALCEEFGNLIGIIILLCYLGIILQCVTIAIRLKNEFHIQIIIGIAAVFAVQTFIIVGGVLKLIPLTGITSPFLSAGGSSIVVSIGMIGLITYFSYSSKNEEVREEENNG